MEPPIFPNYMQVKQIIPTWVWHILRVLSVSCVALVCYLLYKEPLVGLFLFWGVFIPFAPLVFFIAPGFWRNICPMATVNQISKEFKITRAMPLPTWVKGYSNIIAMSMIFAIIPARKYLFEHDSGSLAILIIFFMLFAFVGGFVFKGKSGWCSSVCPLLPFQRLYGQTPFINVRNAHCRPCVGCTDTCYDFNPAVSYVASLNGRDHLTAAHRKLFAASLPGLIFAFFTVSIAAPHSIAEMYMRGAMIVSVSIACFYLLISIVKISESKVSALFGAISLNLFYWFTFPSIISRYNALLPFTIPNSLGTILSYIIFILTLIWLNRTFKKENLFFSVSNPRPSAKVEDIKILQEYRKDINDKPVVSILPGNRHIVYQEDNLNLLDLLEKEGCKIEAGCRMGLCGADPVTILEGEENLNEVKDDERATLTRLGLSENSRMACCVKVKGNISITLGAEAAAIKTQARPPTQDFSAIKTVVIIGGGVGGMTAAFNIHQQHQGCKLVVIQKEGYPYYNRMAISRLLHGRSNIENLFLTPKNWLENSKTDYWSNSRAIKIDRINKTVETASHDHIQYDKLILAMGSSSFVPPIKNYGIPGCFVLREATDAINIHAYADNHNCKRAFVAGGGLLGIEAAFELQKKNLQVTVLEKGSRLLSKQLDKTGSHYLQNYLESLGIRIIYDAVALEVIGDPYLNKIILENLGEFKCDLFLVCAGIRPNVDLAKAAELTVNRGVVVDDYFRTSDADIYAVGEVAEIQGQIESLWSSVTRQAEVVSKNLLGIETKYQLTVPNAVLKIAGINVVSIGATEPQASTDIVIQHEKLDSRQYCKLIISDNKVIGAILIGYDKESFVITGLVQNKKDISGKISQLKNGDFSGLSES